MIIDPFVHPLNNVAMQAIPFRDSFPSNLIKQFGNIPTIAFSNKINFWNVSSLSPLSMHFTCVYVLIRVCSFDQGICTYVWVTLCTLEKDNFFPLPFSVIHTKVKPPLSAMLLTIFSVFLLHTKWRHVPVS